MSEQPGSYQTQKTNAEPTVAELKRQAHGLVDVISRRPGAVKLLLGVLPMLKTFANYKANRRRASR